MRTWQVLIFLFLTFVLAGYALLALLMLARAFSDLISDRD